MIIDKDKFVKIPTELFEALMRASLTKTQMMVFLYVIRKTYGWNKYIDVISISQAAKELGKDRRWIQRAFRDLEAMGMIQINNKTSGRPSEISINDPDDWDKPASEYTQVTCEPLHAGRPASEYTQGGACKDSQGGASEYTQVPASESSHTKDIYKDNIKDKRKTRDFIPDFGAMYTDEELEAFRKDGWS